MTTWDEFRAMDARAQVEAAVQAMRTVVAGRELYQYERPNGVCAYTVPGDDGARVPSCLVGHVLMSFDGCPSLPEGGIVGISATTLHLHPETVAVLAVAQRAQDDLLPWGQCFDLAYAVYVALKG